MDTTGITKRWFWTGLILICVLYCLYYVLFLYRMALAMPIHGRHVIKLLFILMVYSAGFAFLPKWGMPWMSALGRTRAAV